MNQTKNKYTRWVKKLGLLFIWPIKIKCLQLLSIKHHNFSGYLSAWAWVIESTKYFGLEAMLIGHTIFMSSASRVSLFWLSNPLLLDWTTKDYTISKASAKQHQNTKKQMDKRALIHLCHLNQRPTSAIQRWILAQTLITKGLKQPNCAQKNLHPSDKRDAPAV